MNKLTWFKANMKTKSLSMLILVLQFFALSCRDHVRITLDKTQIAPGETITARLYVQNKEEFLPAFGVVRGQDTTYLPIDTNEKDCGVFRGTSHRIGENVIKGFVIYFDKNSMKHILDYNFKFKVLPIPGTENNKYN
jgi:hypothetical protein